MPRLQVLFVHDSDSEVQLLARTLEQNGFDVSWERVDAEPSLRRALGAAQPDVLISDFSMQRLEGRQALHIVRELAPAVPFVFASGAFSAEVELEAIAQGASDCVLKDDPRRLTAAVRRALAESATRKAYEVRLERLAHYDALTGLPNRTLLSDRATQAIAYARRANRPAALLALGIDHFKLVNESYGHDTGDKLLRLVAARLNSIVRAGDTAARLGADTFAVLAADLARAEDTLAVARKVQDSLQAPFTLGGRQLHLTVSIGASTYPRDGEDFDVLLRNADAAMQRLKVDGGNNFQFYAASMTREAVERVELESELRRALARKELELHFQPQVALDTSRIIAVEALMRWHHRDRGWISPATFVPIAEASGMIHELGQVALIEGCRQIKQWDGAGSAAPLRLAVNISARQFRNPMLAEDIAGALETAQLEPARLELELTEGVFVQKQDEAVSLLHRLKDLGVRIAIDDFGTGYSNLSYLSRLPIDCLKIDRSFVNRVGEHGRDAAIARAVVSLAHSLGLRVVAEGVETMDQMEFLRSHACDEGQGYLFARPLGADALQPILAAGSFPQAMRPITI